VQRFVSIPHQHAELIAVEGDGALTLNLYRLHRPDEERARTDGPAVLFGHACGFAAGSYLPLLTKVSELADVFAFDARGHGGSDVPPADAAPCGPDRHALDLARIAQAVAARARAPIFFVGHSMGAAAMLRLGSIHRELFASLSWRGILLFEPPVFPSPDRPEHAECLAKDRALVRRTAARRAHWPSREAFVAALAGRGPFQRIDREALAAHAAATLRPAAAGAGFDLCCPPAIEANTYSSFGEDSTFRALSAFPRDIPMHLVGGDATDADARSWVTLIAPIIANALGLRHDGRSQRRFTALSGRGHLMLLEDAEMTRELIRVFLSSL
jgi:pimeloyl-ACP methyl ester carboxylesterase